MSEPLAPPADLREQVDARLRDVWMQAGLDTDEAAQSLPYFTDAVLAVFAERERLLRERVEVIELDALPRSQFGLGARAMKQRVLAVFNA